MRDLKKKQEGFTIIEVLIVLAIAGLIILIVFLAVPALQRNSRNTQRKNDVQNALGALSEYVNNHNGQLPADQAAFNADVKPNIKQSFFTDDADLVYGTGVPGTIDENVLYISKGVKCSGAAMTVTGASSRNIAAVYSIETSGALTPQCQES